MDLHFLCKKEEALQKKKHLGFLRSSSPVLSIESFSIYRPPKGEAPNFGFGTTKHLNEREFIIRNRN